MQKLKVLHDKVLIKEPPKEETTKCGIILPDGVEGTKNHLLGTGIVYAVGQGRISEENVLIPNDVEQGDKVLFRKYRADEVEIDEEVYLMVDNLSIIAKIGESKEGAIEIKPHLPKFD